MIKSLFISLWILLGCMGVFAQQKVTVKMPIADTSKYIQLAHYYGYKQFIKVDSAKVGADGLLHFSNKNEPWKGGIYLVVASPSKFYDFAFSGKEDNIYMEFDTTDYVNTVKFKNSPENDYLFKYRRFLDKKSKEGKALQEQFKIEKDPAKVSEIRSKLQRIGKDVNNEIRSLSSAKKDLFASRIMVANLDPEVPETIPTLTNGRPDSTFAYRYYKSNFFNHIDFSDDRLIRTPFLEGRLEKYFTNLVYPKKDSIVKDVDYVLTKAKANKEVYRYTLWYLTNKYETTDIVGLDGVVVHMYENHYLKDADWLDEDQKRRFQERLSIMKPLETGKVMPTLILKDTLGVVHNLKDVKSKYTLVYFYSPDCGHCQDHAPTLVKFFDENKDKGFTVWNVSTERKQDVNEVKDFIKTYDTGRLTNLYDPDRRYDFNTAYDVYSTPTLFILDDQKRIVGKRIPLEEILGFIEFYEKNKSSFR